MNLQTNNIYQSDIIRASGMNLPWELLNEKKIFISGASGMISSVIIDILMKRNREYGQKIHIYAISRGEQKARKHVQLTETKLIIRKPV